MRVTRRALSHWYNWLGLTLVAVFAFIAVAAPLLSPEDPKNPGPVKMVGRITNKIPQTPSPEAPLGTFPGQGSVYHSLVWGARSAMLFGLSTALFTAVIGVIVGAASAYFGGFFNDLMMRVTDAFLAFPMIAGVVLITQVIFITLSNAGAYMIPTVYTFNPMAGTVIIPEDLPPFLVFLNQIDPVMIAFILFSWMTYARIMNTSVLTIIQTEYVQAARALGAGHSQVIFRHLIPNAIAPMIVLVARDVGGMVLLQATFTFIGMGGDSLWGMLLARGRDWIIGPGGNILAYWWLFLPATLAILLFGIGWNMVGDFLNDVLNPPRR